MSADLALSFDDVLASAFDEPSIDLIAAHLPRGTGNVLVAAADHGRTLVQLIRRGFVADAIEHTAGAMQAAQRRLGDRDANATVVRQELDQLNLPFRYAGAYVAARGWQVLDRRRAARALELLRGHLVEPGVLLLQGYIPDLAAHPPGAPIIEIERKRQPDGSIITRRRERRVDREAQLIVQDERYEQRRGMNVVAREDQGSTLAWYTPEEAIALMHASGFAGAVAVEQPIPPADAPEDGRAFLLRATIDDQR